MLGLQSLKITVSKTFKDHLRKECESCLFSKNLSQTSSDKIKIVNTCRVNINVLGNFLETIVEHSFEKCSIINSLENPEG